MSNSAGMAGARWNEANPVERHVRAGIGETYEPNSKEEEALYELYKRWDPSARDANHYQYHRTWWLSVAYYAGLQWVNWNETYTKLADRKVPPWRRLYQANMIFPMVMRNFSKITADQTTPFVPPATIDRDDIKSARLAEKAIEHGIHVSNYDEARDDARLWALVCGSGFVKFTWNPSKGPIVEQDGKAIPLGEIEADVASPFSIRIPQNAATHKHLPWMIQITTRHMEYVHERWKDKAKYVTPDSTGARENFLEDRVQSIVGIRGFTSTLDTEHEPNAVKIVEMWCRPFAGKPKGMHIIVANGVVLETQDENPYEEMGIGLPYVHFKYASIPGRYWGMGLVEQIIFPQREYNVSRSQVIENQNLMSRPKWLVPRGHGLPRVAITSEPGEIIEYNAALPKPEQVAVAPLPNYVLDHQQRCINEMQEIAGQHDVTQAKAPASVRSGVAINLLQQQDSAVLGMPIKNDRRANERAFTFMLKMMMDRYEEPRVLQVFGRDEALNIEAFRGIDLRGHTSVRLKAQSGLLETPEGRRQAVLDYIELGILDVANPEEKRAVLKALDMEDIDTFISETLIDERNAEMENEMMTKSMDDGGSSVPPVQQWEDHAIHIRRHDLFRKSPEYRALSENQQVAFNGHVEAHMAYIMMAMQQQQEQTMAARGGPGDTGEPSSPKRGGGESNATGGPSSGEGNSQEGGGQEAGSGGGGGE